MVARGLLSEEQCQRAVAEGAKTKSAFKDSVLRMGMVKEEDLLIAEADVLGLTFLDLDQYLIDEDVVRLVPEKIARSRLVMPVFKVGGSLTVATVDPLNILALDEVRAASHAEVEAVISTRDTIRRAIDQYYGVGNTVAEAAKAIEPVGLRTRRESDTLQNVEAINKAAEEAPVIKLVNLIILKALEEKASDIHIEPEEDLLRVRNRVDGVMHEASSLPKKLQLAVASRIKIMAKLDIAESRKPQDGKIRLRVEERELDIRVSTFPTMHGENIVMRLLEPSKLILGLGDLGMEGDVLQKFNLLIRKAYGMVLVTGPTGAGKTTTLYSALNTINTIEKNIITLEDPVEYQLPLVRQTQVNAKAGLTFATGLRNILRQDPDIILVGEIRDAETADIAIQAALTGHLVFSTIHTNDSAGAVARLIDMDIEPFLISSALVGVLAQRLVRTLCPKCREIFKPDPELLKKMGIREGTYYRPKGCNECRGVGYLSRVGIYELLVLDESVRRLVIQRASSGEIKAAALKGGMLPFRTDGLRKAERGITSLEEVLKVTVEDD
ncbi:MAG TPA: ATPase, T2SS/T4P/T4SS family [Candidatus Eisenbacteria bacterium]|nr:ATPase, T2SS/T4P/T4SS family [Candidatus Eisenbacteria bacterium]